MWGAFLVWNATTSFPPFSLKRNRVSLGESVTEAKTVSWVLHAQWIFPPITQGDWENALATPGCDSSSVLNTFFANSLRSILYDSSKARTPTVVPEPLIKSTSSPLPAENHSGA